MSNPEIKESEWELSKENIQPLKQGRKVAVLADALDESHHHKLSLQKHEFEKELRTYSGDDPLGIWHRYALWIEQNYPKGGKDGNLKKLLDSCFTTLSSSLQIDKYKNDERYLDLWVKYANQSPSPLEIYQILNSKKLCTDLAKFYESWAWEVEKTKNYNKANTIYIEGLHRKAKPIESLEMAHSKFQARVAHYIIAQGDNQSEDQSVSADSNRVVLSSLKSKGAKARAPIERTGTSIIGSAGHVASDFSRPNTLGAKFQIFQDENAASENALRAPLSSKPVLPNQIISNKENVKDPARWTKNKVTQRSVPLISVEDVHKLNQPSFRFHVDENAPDARVAMTTKPEVSGVLSVRKEKEWIVPLFIAEEFNPLSQPQYCKNKVYCGTEEFSFEELRAAKEVERTKELESIAIKEELIQLKDIVLQQKELIIQLQQQKKDIKKEPNCKVHEDSCISINNKSVNVTHNVSQNSSNISYDNTKLLINQAPPEVSKLSLLPNECLNPEILNAIGIPSYESHNSSTKGVAPSPTINTKIANKVIEGLLCGRLFHNSASEKSLDDVERVNRENIPSLSIEEEAPLSASASVPFTIFCDDESGEIKNPNIHNSSAFNKQKSMANNENAAPPDYIKCQNRRTFAGVLQPSVGIPVLPLESQEPGQEREDMLEGLDAIDGVDDLIAPPEEDFTIKIPSNQAFAKCVKVASTPSPWAFCGQNTPDDDTFAIPIMREEDMIENRNFGESSKQETLHSPDSGKSSESIEGNSGEIMPPPPVMTQENESHSENSLLSEKTYEGIHKTQALSPIFEASREYRSSSSNSSVGTTLISQTNIHGITHVLHQTGISGLHYASQSGALPGGITNNQTSAYDATKSGYFADKSCENTADLAAPKSHQKRRKRTDSFDPDKIAAALMECDEDHPASTETNAEVHLAQDDKSSLLKGPFSYPEEIDPFCERLQEALLASLALPIYKRAGFVPLDTKMPQIKSNAKLSFGSERFFDCRLRGSGSYAQVYEASTTDSMNVTMINDLYEDLFEKSHMILKVQRPPALWEFYICYELRERLKAKGSQHLLNSFMRVNRGYFFEQGSILVSDYHKHGILLNIVNGYKKAGRLLPQSVVMYYTVQLLLLIDQLHSCEIIHGDMKPDNILIVGIPTVLENVESFMNCNTCIKLIDFGRSIDMKLLPKNATFLKKVKTDGFQCCEMRDDRPWSYQTDLYGAASVAHCLLWGSYMNVKKAGHQWMPSGVNYQRFWNKNFWQTFFKQMLNIPSCSQLPSLKSIIKSFTDELFKENNRTSFSSEIKFLTRIINEGK